MKRYRVDLTPAAARQLDRLDKRTREAALAVIETLGDDPRPAGCVKLVGTSDLWRVRFGRHRLVYRIEDARLLVLVLKIADRKDVYR